MNMSMIQTSPVGGQRGSTTEYQQKWHEMSSIHCFKKSMTIATKLYAIIERMLRLNIMYRMYCMYVRILYGL